MLWLGSDGAGVTLVSKLVLCSADSAAVKALGCYGVKGGDREAKDLGITMVVCPPYIYSKEAV
jgi:hypothetical protein